METKDIQNWDRRLKIIKRLRSLRKKQGIKVRLLMTTGCVEYWFMLHYKMYAPPIQTVADKERIKADLVKFVPDYKKGDINSTFKIAQKYPEAVKNAKHIFSDLLQVGLPGLKDTDERNGWLCKQCLTFSNVYEAIDFLVSLQ